MLKEHRLNNLYARYGVVFFLLFFALSWQPVAAKDDASATKQLIERAKSGSSDAQYELGLRYRDGDGVVQSDRNAAKWLLKAYKKGKNYDAAVDLGDLYMLGRGFNIEFARNQSAGGRHHVDKAMRLYKKAAANGNARGQYRLGTLLMPSDRVDGSLVYKALTKSSSLYTIDLRDLRSVPDGDFSLNTLERTSNMKFTRNQAGEEHHNVDKAWANFTGVHTDPNVHLSKKFPRAEKWLLAAAAGGSAEAQYTLGRLYTQNEFGPERKRKAIELFEAAAKQGHLPAANELGVIHAQGG